MLTIHPSSIYRTTYSPPTHPSTHLPIHSSTFPLIHLAIHLSSHPSIHSPIHAQSSIYHPAIHHSSNHHILTHLPIYSSIHLLTHHLPTTYPFFCPFIYASSQPSIFPSSCLSIQPSICSSTYILTHHPSFKSLGKVQMSTSSLQISLLRDSVPWKTRV